MNRTTLLPSLLSLSLTLAGCATVDKPAASDDATSEKSAQTANRIGEAAVTPLSDLNLVRAKIPPVLQAARGAPYALPADRSCAALQAAVKELDTALGPDLDTPKGDDPGLVERGADAAGDAAVSAVRRTTEDVVPFRGWVRKLTGAERRSREVAAAVAAGGVRRAFLKGLGQAAGCEAPAAPRPATQAPTDKPATTSAPRN